MNNILLCSDLDRTILPNGTQEESPQARPLLRSLASRSEITLAYVSGRHKELILQAIEEYSLPVPDYAIGDVGTTIYQVDNGDWNSWQDWHDEIGQDWRGMSHEDLAELLSDIAELRLQESEKQNVYKLSYYVDENVDRNALLEEVQKRLDEQGLETSLIWSVDEQAHVGLLDILPKRATKEHAVRFLMKNKGFGEERTVYAGDSGNDLAPLTSGLQAVLVKNAAEDVRKEALEAVKQKGYPEKLYLAQGGFLEMNGNYSAGVLEGLAHFVPEARRWMERA